jgi:hypothetical protein
MNNPNQSPINFLKYSRDFLIAAEIVHNKSNETPLPLLTYFLYGRSIELSLKAYLLTCGYTIDVLKKKVFGHNLKALFNEAINKNICEIIEIDRLEEGVLEALNFSYKDKQYEYHPDRPNSETGCYYHVPYIEVVEQLARKLVAGLDRNFNKSDDADWEKYLSCSP